MQILGVALVLAAAGAFGVWRLRGPKETYRAGPWPGLTPRGAGMVLSFAALLGSGVLLASAVSVEAGMLVAAGSLVAGLLGALPTVVWLWLCTLGPLALATCMLRLPGVCSAVSGAYLLPRTLLSLVVPSLALPPPLLVPALAFDLVVWLRAEDLRALWPRRRTAWRRRIRVERSVLPWRVIVGGLCYGVVLALVEPAFAAFSATGTGS